MLFNMGFNYGGIVFMVYGWFIVGVFILFVGVFMVEICLVFLILGGFYYWSL